MQFKRWLETHQYNINRLPLILKGLAAEAKKAPSFEDFAKDFSIQIKHGLYWHWTNDPNFQIDPTKGPRDMSSMADGGEDKGKLMITSDLHGWSLYGPNQKGRQYAAIIDMSNVPRNAYWQVKRGFGNEFYVNDPSNAKVAKVVPRVQAFKIDREQQAYLPQNDEELLNFYNAAR
jgi:hypothetical protein